METGRERESERGREREREKERERERERKIVIGSCDLRCSGKISWERQRRVCVYERERERKRDRESSALSHPALVLLSFPLGRKEGRKEGLMRMFDVRLMAGLTE